MHFWGERLPDFLWRFKEIRNTEDFSALKKNTQDFSALKKKYSYKQNQTKHPTPTSWTSLNTRRWWFWWFLLYYSQELRLKGLNTSWHSCDCPDACAACSCRTMPAWGSLQLTLCDIKVAHRTLSVYLMANIEQTYIESSLTFCSQ